MYRVSKEASFSAAHHLRNYKGKCEHLHGHNWRVQVTVEGRALGPGGMLIDFNELKTALAEVIARLDHTDLNTVPPFDREEPSAENIARLVAAEVGRMVNTPGARVREVAVWETPASVAVFVVDD